MSIKGSRLATVLATLLPLVAFSVLVGADWPRFRGADGSGASAETGLPLHWSEDDGLVWRTELPGPGSSCPVVSAERVFLTCYSGYGVDRDDPGDPAGLRRHVVCVGKESGKLLWDRSIESSQRVSPFRGVGMPHHGYASSTPVADGERVYAFFGTAGVVAFDFGGNELWRKSVAPQPSTHRFGSAASPILFENLLIVSASVECEALVAYNKLTGDEVWRTPATGYGGWWSTPILVDVGKRQELVVSVPDELWGLNPKNGKLRWYAESFSARNICTSVVATDGVVYAIGGRDGGSAAVRLGGRGDVTQSHVAWSQDDKSYVTSPVVDKEHLYFVTERALFFCLKADGGERVARERLSGAGKIYASPLLADGKLFVVTRRNGTFVLAAQPEFKQLAHNTFESDDSDFNASPAVSDGRLFLRSNRYLYCVTR